MTCWSPWLRAPRAMGRAGRTPGPGTSRRRGAWPRPPRPPRLGSPCRRRPPPRLRARRATPPEG
eukprot:10033495-Alexandrium_andersonii.AAC.1